MRRRTDLGALVRGLVWPIFPVVVGLLGLRSAWRLQRAAWTEARIPLRPRRVLSFFSLILIAGELHGAHHIGVIDPVIPLVLFVVGMMTSGGGDGQENFHLGVRAGPEHKFGTNRSPFRRDGWRPPPAGCGVLKGPRRGRSPVAAAHALGAGGDHQGRRRRGRADRGNRAAEHRAAGDRSVRDTSRKTPRVDQRISDGMKNELALVEDRLRSDTVRLLPPRLRGAPRGQLMPGAVAARVDGALSPRAAR